MDDDVAPELVAEELLHFFEVVRRVTSPPGRHLEAHARGGDILLPPEAPPPPLPEAVLAGCVTSLPVAERAQLRDLIVKMKDAILKRPR